MNWYKSGLTEGDLLEVGFEKKKGFMKDVGNDVFIRLDQKGHILGFAILNATKRLKGIKELELPVKGKLISVE